MCKLVEVFPWWRYSIKDKNWITKKELMQHNFSVAPSFRYWKPLTYGLVIIFTVVIYLRPPEILSTVFTHDALLQMYIEKTTRMSDKVNRGEKSYTICDEKSKGESCIDSKCNTAITPIPDVLTELLSRRKTVPELYMKVINSMTSDEDHADIVFVTAASENHYLENAAMFKTLHENVLPVLEKRFTVKVFLYDIGLNTKQRQMMEKHCKCTVRTYPFSSFPKFTRFIRSYIWKPIMVRAHLPRSDITIWMDSSVRFLPGNEMLNALARVYNFGMGIASGSASMAQHAHPEMMAVFGETFCPFSRYKEVLGTFLMFHNEPLVQDAVVDTWVGCGFHKKCMATTQPIKNWACNMSKRQYGKCHRFDQSAIGMITVKLFQTKIDNLVIPRIITIDKRDKTKYFPDIK